MPFTVYTGFRTFLHRSTPSTCQYERTSNRHIRHARCAVVRDATRFEVDVDDVGDVEDVARRVLAQSALVARQPTDLGAGYVVLAIE